MPRKSNSWAKAGAYMGLAFVPAVSGYVGYWVGTQIDARYGTGYGQLTGMLLGLAAGFYELYRQAMRIEGRGQS
jgi:hypothetical protein